MVAQGDTFFMFQEFQIILNDYSSLVTGVKPATPENLLHFKNLIIAQEGLMGVGNIERGVSFAPNHPRHAEALAISNQLREAMNFAGNQDFLGVAMANASNSREKIYPWDFMADPYLRQVFYLGYDTETAICAKRNYLMDETANVMQGRSSLLGFH